MLRVARGRPDLTAPCLSLFLLFAILCGCADCFLAVGFFSYFFV